MALQNLVRSQIDNAFNLAGDLVSEFSFYQVSAGEYDFSTGETTITTSEPVTYQGLVVSRTNNPDEGTELRVLLKSNDVSVDIDIFDRVDLDDVEYKLYSWEDNGYTIDLRLRVGS